MELLWLVLRVFEAPWAFVETLQKVAAVAPPADLKPTSRPMGYEAFEDYACVVGDALFCF